MNANGPPPHSETGDVISPSCRNRETQTPRWKRWIFPSIGAISLIWFLCRVIPKPSRAAYPCVRASFPAAAAFVVWLLGVWGALFSFRKARRTFREGRYAAAATLLLAGVGALALWWLSPVSLVDKAFAFIPSEGRNNPIGEGKGVFPGRVVWVRDPRAARWDGVTGQWWNDSATDQVRVDGMMSLALRRLTAAPTDEAAWEMIFGHSNATRGRGSAGYRSGEKLALKINCNNSTSYGDADNQIDASPQVVLALLRQLVEKAGLPQSMITVYDAGPAPRVVPDRVYNKSHAAFPDVNWVDYTGGASGRVAAQWINALSYSTNNSNCGTSIPTCAQQATYLINLALCKGHSIAGVTLTAKNHYGSINARDHNNYVDCRNHPMGVYHPFVDLIGSDHLGGKTILFMIDALYGVHDVGDRVDTYGRWNNLFGGHWSASLFASFDPVAIDSVALDFLSAEYGAALGNGRSANADNYLHEAALAHIPPSGTAYRPNGARLISSLGTHEHWNNPTDKLYSRNLGRSYGIELVRVEPPLSQALLVGPGSAWKYLDTGIDLGTAWRAAGFNDSAWPTGPAPLGYGDANGLWPRTTNSFGPNPNSKHTTTYYRHAFTATRTAAFTNLNLAIQRDDGAVVYLNGTEVFRSNMPAGTVGYSTFSSSVVGGADESAWHATSADPRLLVEGLNVLAAEVHQCNLTSSDLFFDLILSAAGEAPPLFLGWTREGSRLNFSWPDRPEDLFLQSAPLLPGANWASLTNVPAVSNGLLRLRFDATNEQGFFRLKNAN